MNIDSPLFAILILALMLGCAWLTLRLAPIELPDGRLTSIDGLRGFLAVSVFIHHAMIWRDYLLLGRWQAPESNLYNELGQSSVGLFFMVTGFLFTRRLLDTEMDWVRLYAGRVMRLAPLYLFAITLMFALVAWRSDFTLHQPAHDVVVQSLRWLSFGFWAPPINGVAETGTMTAYVTWTLPWEWKFYLALPFIAFGLRHRQKRAVFALGIAVVALLLMFTSMPRFFLCGFAAAVLVRDPRWLAFARTRRASLVVIVCLLATLLLFHGAFKLAPMVLLAVVFAIIAGGNTLYGALAWRPSRLLGEISFSVYLLHGLLLFVMFRTVLPAPEELSAMQHWLAVIGAAPILFLASLCTFWFVEREGIRHTDALNGWVRGRFPFLRAAVKV